MDHFKKKYELILNLIAATHLKKVGTMSCLPLCRIPSTFNNTVNVCEVRRPAAGPLGKECCPILVWYVILAAKQSWLFFVIFSLLQCFQYFLNIWGHPIQTMPGPYADLKLIYTFQHWQCASRCASCKFYRLLHTLEMQAFKLGADNKLDGPRLLQSRGCSIHVFQKGL